MVTCLYTSRPLLYPEVTRGYDLECIRILPCILVSSITKSAPPVTILFGGITSGLEVLACSPLAIQRFDSDSGIHFLCLYVICFES